MQASDEAQSDRRRLGRDASVYPGSAGENSAQRFFRNLECNALKSHDSRVKKRVKSSVERMSNARCMTPDGARTRLALSFGVVARRLNRAENDIRVGRLRKGLGDLVATVLHIRRAATKFL